MYVVGGAWHHDMLDVVASDQQHGNAPHHTRQLRTGATAQADVERLGMAFLHSVSCQTSVVLLLGILA
jgi:hypothetical protein